MRRPTLGRLPFSDTLRPSPQAAWLHVMRGARVIAFVVHPSGEALLYAGLRESALLHFSLLLWLRRYREAANVLHACTLDSRPSDEQTWLAHNALCSCDDTHPDAIALRLRLQVC